MLHLKPTSVIIHDNGGYPLTNRCLKRINKTYVVDLLRRFGGILFLAFLITFSYVTTEDAFNYSLIPYSESGLGLSAFFSIFMHSTFFHFIGNLAGLLVLSVLLDFFAYPVNISLLCGLLILLLIPICWILEVLLFYSVKYFLIVTKTVGLSAILFGLTIIFICDIDLPTSQKPLLFRVYTMNDIYLFAISSFAVGGGLLLAGAVFGYVGYILGCIGVVGFIVSDLYKKVREQNFLAIFRFMAVLILWINETVEKNTGHLVGMILGLCWILGTGLWNSNSRRRFFFLILGIIAVMILLMATSSYSSTYLSNVNHDREIEPITPLMISALNGWPVHAKKLIETGGEVDARTENGTTALMYTAISNTSDVTRVLIENGKANLNLADTMGYTALILSAYYNTPGVAQCLIENNADLFAAVKPSKTNEKGARALSVAIQMGSVDVVRLLIEAGATEPPHS